LGVWQAKSHLPGCSCFEDSIKDTQAKFDAVEKNKNFP